MNTKNARNRVLGAVGGSAAILAVAGVATFGGVASANTSSSTLSSGGQTAHSIRLISIHKEAQDDGQDGSHVFLYPDGLTKD